MPVIKERLVDKETDNYSGFAGFKLLDEIREILPWLPVIIVSRYANLNMARHAIGSKVQDILSKDIVFNNSDELLKSIRKNMVPIHQGIINLGHERLLEFLKGASEQMITLKVLVPLFYKLGFHEIRYIHGRNECGLDHIFSHEDLLHTKRYIGVQVKVNEIHKSVGKPPEKKYSQEIIIMLNIVINCLCIGYYL